MTSKTLVDALGAAPAERPFVTMYHGESEPSRVTFGAFRRRAAAMSAILREHGAGAGDTIVLIMRQGIDLMAAFAGAMAIGAAPAILAYPHRKIEPDKYRRGLAGVTANLAASLLVLDEAFPDDLSATLGAAGSATVVRGFSSGPAERPWSSDGGDPHSVAFIQHSAGTTGLQKAVALSHASVLTQLDGLAAVLHVSDDDRLYSWLPLYHDMGTRPPLATPRP